MSKSVADLYIQAEVLAPDLKGNFVELAEIVRQICAVDPDGLAKLIGEKVLERRTAYYLLEIGKAFVGLDVPPDVLKAIGWTKTAMIAKHVDPVMVGSLIDLAQRATVRDLRSILDGHTPTEPSHCVLLYFRPDDYGIYEKAVLANGGKKSKRGRGLVGQEDAVLRIIGKSARRRFPKLPG